MPMSDIREGPGIRCRIPVFVGPVGLRSRGLRPFSDKTHLTCLSIDRRMEEPSVGVAEPSVGLEEPKVPKVDASRARVSISLE